FPGSIPAWRAITRPSVPPERARFFIKYPGHQQAISSLLTEISLARFVPLSQLLARQSTRCSDTTPPAR
nr:hypothetical protein [Candidatus Sigynarchaeota archaeon]